MATQNIYDLSDTWNNAPTVFTSVKMNVTDTASDASSLLLDLQVGGVSKFNVDKDGIVTTGNGTLISDMSETWNNGGTTFNAIKFNITDTASAADSNLLNLQVGGTTLMKVTKVGKIDLSAVTGGIAMEVGSSRAINAINGDHFFGSSGETISGNSPSIHMRSNDNIIFRTQNTVRWQFQTTGHFFASTDDTYDIGAAGANRPRNMYLAGGTVIMSNLPTSDPTNTGQLWNDSGTVKVSA